MNAPTREPSGHDKTMPSQVRDTPTLFDRFATGADTLTSKAGFFAVCVLMVIIWIPTFLVLPSVDTWQLVINTATTIVTFLLVALLQNTQSRSDEAVQQKLNAIADALSNLMGQLATDYPELGGHRDELIDAVGLETRESA
ncbi:low affinity iron permease family protein [Nocardia takedensis]|uniref:low affinity iron permease family protein n=1 Tax=Nocardia takedensis TaxID=259390 RepID=UPI003F75E9DD